MVSREEIDLGVLESYWGLGVSPDTQPPTSAGSREGQKITKHFLPLEHRGRKSGPLHVHCRALTLSSAPAELCDPGQVIRYLWESFSFENGDNSSDSSAMEITAPLEDFVKIK